MALEMRLQCERCRAYVAPDHRGYICVEENTFCSYCAEALTYRCPVCQGELVRRPRQKIPIHPGPDAPSAGY